MEIIKGIHNIAPGHHGNVITIGNFDGVHRGHQRLIERLRELGVETGVPSMLITFEPQPREFFAGSEVPPRLTRLREKVVLLERHGLDRVVLLPFNERTAQTPARWIADDLVHGLLGAKHVIVGDDFRFGRDREGSYAFLKTVGEEVGYDVSDTRTLEEGGERISSTRIRKALQAADFELATRLLGHEYFIMGRVVYGRQLGRQLGVPTANIRLQRYKAALEGVYCVTIEGVGDDLYHGIANIRLQRYKAALEGVYCVTIEGIGDDLYHGIANIGVRPTVDGKEPLLEVHVFDFSGDLYGQLLTIRFKHKIRDEQAFASVDALKAQIDRDLITARAWFD